MGVKIRKIILYLLFLCITISYVSANVMINEVMYNPTGTDSGREWIEIYSNETVDLSGWKFYEAGISHGLTLINGSWIVEGYAVIVDEWGTFFLDYPNFNGTLLDSSWSSLSNSGEYIAIKDASSDIVDEMNYSAEFANGNGKSLERFGNDWYESLEDMGTPGFKNSYTPNQTGIVDYVIDGDTLELETGERVRLIGIDTPEEGEYYYEEAKNRLKELVEGKSVLLEKDIEDRDMDARLLRYIYIGDLFVNLILVQEGYARACPYEPNIKYQDEFEDAENEAKESKLGIWSLSSLRINEFFPDPAGDDNAPMPEGEFIELYNRGDDMDLAGFYFKDLANHKLYIVDTTTIEGTVIEAGGYLAVYMNQFSGFLNNEGFEEIKLYDLSGELIDEVNYAGSTESLSWALVDGLWNLRLPSPNNKNPEEKVEMESSFKIEGLEDLNADNESEFGDIIKVRFHVYKGNTTKSSIKLYIENDEDRITKITKAMLHDKFTNYSLTLPIQIKPNCNEKYEDGDYYVKIGWTASSEAEDSFKVKVEGINMDNCDKIYVERELRKGTLEHNLVESPAAVEINKDFTVKVELTNNDGQDHLVDLYSYVYRGSKCYSGERDGNKKSVLVKAGQNKEFELKNMFIEGEPGDYKLKIKAKRDDQKTEKEITQVIKVFQGEVEEKEEKIEVKEKDEEEQYTTLESIKKPEIIYESSSIKAEKLVVYFFIGLLIIYAAMLTWRR